MGLEVTSERFVENAEAAVAKERLQATLGLLRFGSGLTRASVKAEFPEFEAFRDEAKAIKDHTLAHLDTYLERFMRAAAAAGTHVHWARDGEEARAIILRICQARGAKLISKSKSMVSEEIELGPYLSAYGMKAVETDLGEYIIQMRGERPSHIIGPAIHLTKADVAETFRKVHDDLPADRPLEAPQDLIREARVKLRDAFLGADVGISGANFLIAETGSIVLVTNEGNAELTTDIPKTHIVITGIEKVVPTLDDASALLRLLARCGTGQEATTYTTFITGPRRGGDADGPEEMHIVLLDNGRSDVLLTEFQDMLRCIRCGACLNQCPVYTVVGGHAYGSVYPGPMGAVLTPMLSSIDEAGHLPNASTFCGKCEEVCPMRIPLPKMMRHWREREFERGLAPPAMRAGLGLWRFVATRPWAYRPALRMGALLLGLLGRRRGAQRWIGTLPVLGEGWTHHRDMRAPEGRTFLDQWAEREGRA